MADRPELVAVNLPPRDAADAIRRLWDENQAVLVLNPSAPSPELDRVVDLARPAAVLDRGGEHRLGGGIAGVPEAAAVVATSGTTGEPKLIEHTRASMRAAAHAVSAAIDATADDVWLCCLPLHYVAGLAIVARSWVTGAGVVLHDGFDLEAVATAPTREGATIVSLVPTMLWRMLAAGMAPKDYRHVLLGGAPVQPDLLERAADAGVSVSTTYGMAETWGGVVHDGIPLEGVELEVMADGEVRLRGAMVMRGYRNRPELTASVLGDDGWYRTGDLGSIGSDGHLRIVERRSDLIITGGVNVSPAEVEAVLGRHPSINEVCVAGADDPEWGQRVVAFVTGTDTSVPPTLEALRQFAASALAAPKLPRQLVVVDAIPRSPAGKILRRSLVERLTGAEAGQAVSRNA